MFSYEICELFKDTFFHRTLLETTSENNKQQQLFEGFANSCCKIISPILLQQLINDIAVSKHARGTLLLAEDVASTVATALETRTMYFIKEPHFLIGQPRTCRIFMIRCIKSIFF